MVCSSAQAATDEMQVWERQVSAKCQQQSVSRVWAKCQQAGSVLLSSSWLQRPVNSWAPPARPFLPPLFISSFFRFPPWPFFQFFNCSFELCFAPVLMSEVSFCRLAPIVLVFIFSGGKTETATAAERSGQWTLGRRAAGLTQLFSFSFAEFQPQNFSKMFL